MGQRMQSETVRLAVILVERHRKRALQMRGLLRTGEEGVEEGTVRQDSRGHERAWPSTQLPCSGDGKAGAGNDTGCASGMCKSHDQHVAYWDST